MSPVEKNLRLHDGRIGLVFGRRLGAKLSVIDGCRIKAGGRGRKYQPSQKNGRSEQAGHPATSSQDMTTINSGLASSAAGSGRRVFRSLGRPLHRRLLDPVLD